MNSKLSLWVIVASLTLVTLVSAQLNISIYQVAGESQQAQVVFSGSVIINQSVNSHGFSTVALRVPATVGEWEGLNEFVFAIGTLFNATVTSANVLSGDFRYELNSTPFIDTTTSNSADVMAFRRISGPNIDDIGMAFESPYAVGTYPSLVTSDVLSWSGNLIVDLGSKGYTELFKETTAQSDRNRFVSGNFNYIEVSLNQTTIPEVSTIATIIGVFAMGGTLFHRVRVSRRRLGARPTN
jgi:hypothetical protein